MPGSPPHRKRVRHYDQPGHAHELTFSCYRRMPLLRKDSWKRLLSESIDRAVQKKNFDLVAFVYMPEHVHIIVHSRLPTTQVERLLYAIKRPFSSRVKREMETGGDPLLEELTIRERPGKQTFRFWQEGPGYDRNLTSPNALISAAEYLHGNPVRRGLCVSPDEWKWSSWRHYHRPDKKPDPDLPTVHGMPF